MRMEASASADRLGERMFIWWMCQIRRVGANRYEPKSFNERKALWQYDIVLFAPQLKVNTLGGVHSAPARDYSAIGYDRHRVNSLVGVNSQAYSSLAKNAQGAYAETICFPTSLPKQKP